MQSNILFKPFPLRYLYLFMGHPILIHFKGKFKFNRSSLIFDNTLLLLSRVAALTAIQKRPLLVLLKITVLENLDNS